MGPRRLVVMRGVGVLVTALVVGGSALAQDAPRPGPGPGGQGLATGGALAPVGGAVDTSQGGVGGTGLGKMPSGSKEGTGMSVQGPPGQGIQPMQKPK